MAKKIVVDSTIIIKWLNRHNELNIDQADKILGDVYAGKITLFAPELAKDEIGKILLQGKRLSQSESKTPLSLLFDLPIQFMTQSQKLSKESFAIAQAYGISYNESVFLALSEQESAIYVTDSVNKQALATGAKILTLRDY